MPFGLVGRIGPGMRQLVVISGDRSTGGGNFGANVGRPIVTSGEFAASRPPPKITLGYLAIVVGGLGDVVERMHDASTRHRRCTRHIAESCCFYLLLVFSRVLRR